MSLKDLFFGNDNESEETKMSEELKNEAAASENKEGNLVTPDMLVGDIITTLPGLVGHRQCREEHQK